MEARAFLARIPTIVRSALPSEVRPFMTSGGYGLVKLSYGNARIHYEADHQPRSQVVEIGLHFEADPFTNARLLGAFRIHAKRIAHDLPNARIEEWDKGWARVWEPVPYEELDAALQREVAARLARYITVLEPLLRDELPADVPWQVSAPTRPAARRASARRSPSPRKRSR